MYTRFLDERDGASAHRFAAAHRVHAFAAFSFDTDLARLDSEGGGQSFPHPGNIRRQLRSLEADGGIDVDDGIAGPVKQFSDVAKKEQA